MTQRRVRLRPDSGAAALAAAFAAIRLEHEVPAEFPPHVLGEAQAAARALRPPTRDETAVEFVTIDPPGSKDLDQALAIETDGPGYRVRYAIADVPAFVEPGGAVDVEARRRVQTLYLPDGRSPLHPPVLSEGAASLLPDADRSAYVWDLRLDADAVVEEAQVYRALVRSRAQLDYAAVQADLDAGRAPRVIELLAQVGPRRMELESARGGASLPMPEQEIQVEGSGPDAVYRLRYRPPAPVEDYNAQISLMTGMAAADLMLDGGIGILRTMPPPEEETVRRFRRVVAAHGLTWPQEQSYGAFLRGLDRTDPVHLAIIHEATGLFRGAGYTPFDGTRPEQVQHAAVADAYAHVTAPLRRLVDRFGLAVCAALSAGEEVPDWVRAALPELPEIMRAGDRRASAIERACTDAVEAAELHDRVGQEFEAVVVDERGEKGYVVALIDPAIVAPCRRPEGSAAPSAGDTVRVRLVEADIEARTVSFEIAGR